MSKKPKTADDSFSKEQIVALFPLLYDYWYTNRSLRARQFIRNVLRPRKDKELRLKYAKRIMVLNKEVSVLNDEISAVLHPDKEAQEANKEKQ